LEAAQPVCLAARKEDESWRWHERYEHLSFEALHQLGKQGMVRGMPVIKHAEQVCDTCVTTKLRRKPFPQQAQYRAQAPLDLVHGDLCGPVTPATPGGRRYFLLMVDDATRFMWAVLLPTKDAAADAVKRVKAEAEKETGRELKVLRTDNGGEFTVGELAQYFAAEGVKRHYSAPLTAAERCGGAAQSDGRGDRTRAPEAEVHAGQILGGGGDDGGASAQPRADKKLARQDPP